EPGPASTVRCASLHLRLLAGLAAMMDAQYHKAFAIDAVLKDIGCVKHLQGELAIFLPSGDRSPELRVRSQHLDLGDDLSRDLRGERRMLAMEEFGESFEVGKSFVRPIEGHYLRRLRYAGVPQV